MNEHCGVRVVNGLDSAFICTRDRGHAGRHLAVKRKGMPRADRLKVKARLPLPLPEAMAIVVDLEIDKDTGTIYYQGNEVGRTDSGVVEALVADIKHLSLTDTGKCWRHEYGHREYVCTCNPPMLGDTGYEEKP